MMQKKGGLMIKVLFVCLGNICRSPMAHFVFKDMVEKKGISHLFEIESAGTEKFNSLCKAGIHYGTKEIFKRMNIPFEEHISRHFTKEFYDEYDYILAMDDENVKDILSIIGGTDKQHKVKRLMDYTLSPANVKDPWYTGNFDETYWDIYEGLNAFLSHLKLGEINE